MEENIELSQGLRMNYWNNVGVSSPLCWVYWQALAVSSKNTPGGHTAVFPLTWQSCESAFWESCGSYDCPSDVKIHFNNINNTGINQRIRASDCPPGAVLSRPMIYYTEMRHSRKVGFISPEQNLE